MRALGFYATLILFSINGWAQTQYEISGRVYLSTGAELPNQSQFRVRTSPGDYTYGFGPNPFSIFVPADTYQLDIEVIGFDLNGARACRLEQDIDNPFAVNGDTVKDLTLPEFLVISGRITDQDGNAIASSTDELGGLSGGATVKFERNDGQGKCPVTVQTDENGDYKIALVASNNYTVTVTPGGSQGSGYTIFSEQAISSNSNAQSYAVFSAVAISRQPSGAVAGEPLEQQPEIVIQNSLGQTFTSVEHTVVTAQLSIMQPSQTSRSESSILISPPLLSGATTIDFVGGRALFTDLTISGGSIGQKMKLVFKTDGGLELESSSFYLEGEGVSSVGLPVWLIWSATRQN
ncbi:MAG: carboxypeptidase-like regulatory domain-containing protein [Candidatus Thioglobus sp.]|nr:carboxypeptidase-like regulatory domain-containing protein [Candidatus Thioglobus sp.]